MYLTECHSTPYYSVLHRDIPTRFPTCSPIERVENRDENTRLWRDPAVLFREMLRDFKHYPSHLLVQAKFEEDFRIGDDYQKVKEWEYSGVVDRVLFGRDGLAVWRRRTK